MMLYHVLYVIPVLLMAAWWCIQRRMMRRRVVYQCNAVLFCLGLAALFWAREVSIEAVKVVFLFVTLVVACTLFWGICDDAGIEPQCRRAKRLAAQQARRFSGSSMPCKWSYSKIHDAMASQAEGERNGYLEIAIELSFCRWNVNLTELPGGGWAMAVCDYLSEDEMIDAELDTIGERHGVERLSQILDAPATAVVLCREQVLHIYPKEHEEEVRKVLQQYAHLTPAQE